MSPFVTGPGEPTERSHGGFSSKARALLRRLILAFVTPSWYRLGDHLPTARRQGPGDASSPELLGRPRSPCAAVRGATLWWWLVLQGQLPGRQGLLEPGPGHLRGRDKGAGCEVTSGQGQYLTRGSQAALYHGPVTRTPLHAEGTLTTGPGLILWRKYWSRSEQRPGQEAVSCPCSQIPRAFSGAQALAPL